MFAVAVLAHKIWGHGPMASAVARSYIGGLEGMESPAGSKGQSLWSGGESPWSWSIFGFWDVHWKPQICPLFETLETQKHQIFICYLCKKIMGDHETGGRGAGAKLGACAPRSGPKTVTGCL